MTCLTTTKKIKYQAYIAQWEGVLAKSVASFTGATASDGIKKYRFDAAGGEASQSAERYDLNVLLKTIQTAEKMIEFYEQKLAGSGVINMNLRRQARAITC